MHGVVFINPGAVALLISAVPPAKRWLLVNPASVKQLLLESAERLVGQGMIIADGGFVFIQQLIVLCFGVYDSQHI